MAGLTPTQRRAFGKLDLIEWRSAYALQESVTTLDSLVRKGLILSRGHGRVGSMFSPRTTIEYKLRAP